MSGPPYKQRRLKPLDPDKGPWVIWSHYHGCWHERSASGGAAGYTTDIAKAGVFEFAMAKAYHDTDTRPKWVRNEAIPTFKVVSMLERRLAGMIEEQTKLAQLIMELKQ